MTGYQIRTTQSPATLDSRLRRLIDGVPDGGMVSLPVERVREWLAEPSAEVERDLMVAEVASFFSRSPVTIRTWIRDGRLRAYRFRGREYRITAAALEAFIRAERPRTVEAD
ncbi:MAG: helix-turn-helix domain-containing protein [Gemmatimonadota bacterium]|nr:helix-turn-helix domain-containing protein [Gemmatimonadota bacterium]MDE3006328.1 helix-turn-helix domain-containing protein [Gemmatimonadota bacterium]MDE3015189.1 helix-turn-helix domain-containing protein [Gemmatimonadota bacterium]